MCHISDEDFLSSSFIARNANNYAVPTFQILTTNFKIRDVPLNQTGFT